MNLLKKFNVPLLILPVLIFSLGYITLLSTSGERAKDQLMFFAAGYVLYILVSFVDIHIFKHYWKSIYYVVLALLFMTLLIGEVRYGSARWFDLGFFTIQPSEFAKIALVLSLSAVIVSDIGILHNFKKFVQILMIVLPVLVVVFLQPDLGTTLVLLGATAVLLFFAGLNRIYFIISLLVFGTFSRPIWELLKDYQKERILVFFNPGLDVLGSGYNVIQALIAVGSGGLMGKGFGRGTQAQHDFLPVNWTDFIFASFAEEWGFIGVLIMMTLFSLLLLSLLFVSYRAKDSYGSLVAVGVFTIFFVQIIINVGMNLGVMPVTGIPLPLVSYGGSSLLTSMILLGIVQSVWTGNKT